MDVLERDAESNSENALEPDVEELPKVVREIVPLEDDPTIPVLTFRYFILSIIFIIPGAFIDTMNLSVQRQQHIQFFCSNRITLVW